MIQWEIKAQELVGCNCAYGCPCQFNALPTHGNCEAIAGIQIEKGHFGQVQLDGLKIIYCIHWPGPIHEGGGTIYVVIDENADDAQKNAILTILSGEETEPGKTIWSVFAPTIDNMHDPISRPIEIDIDIEARRGKLFVDGLVEVNAEPIRNPVTGAEHRARIDLPNGFEYTLAEMGSATGKSSGPVELSFQDTYAQLCHIHLSQSGVVK